MADKSNHTLSKYYVELKRAVGEAMQTASGPSEVVKAFNGAITVKFARYWGAKFADPTLHSSTWGGARNVLFNDQDQELVEVRQFAVLFTSALLSDNAVERSPRQPRSHTKGVRRITAEIRSSCR